MKVKELIEKLKEAPEDAKVLVSYTEEANIIEEEIEDIYVSSNKKEVILER
jgi:hypothetical protein